MATKADLIQKIVDQADSDPEFRKKLVADPAGTLKGLGMTTRPGVKIKVFEETADEGYLVLPFKTKAGAGGALSDDALGAVTGGAAGACPVCGAG